MKVLIIDDDAEDTDMFRDALKEVAPWISCAVANSPALGISQISDNGNPPHYIFLDANMGQTDGKECLTKLRKNESLTGTKIFIYSGHVSDAQLNELTDLGADGYIRKPDSYYALLKVLTSLFKQ